MGEAYRGLTIRIGAETRGLNKALQTINTAARQTQTVLTRVNRALKLDPGSASLQAAKLGLVEEKAESVARGVARMNRGLRESARTTSQFDRQGRTIAELARDTKNATLQYGLMNDRLRGVNTTLETIHDRAGAWLAGPNATKKQAEEGAREISKLSAAAAGSEKSFKDLKAVVTSTFEAMHARGEELPLGAKSVNEAVAAWERLRRSQKEVERDRNAMREARDYQDMVAQVKLAVSETKQLAAEQAKLVSQQERLGTSTGVRRLRGDIEALGADAQETARDFQRLSEAHIIDPRNKKVAEAMMASLRAESAAVTQQLEKARATVARIRSENGAAVTRTAAGGNLYTDARNAEDAYRKARYAVEMVARSLDEAREHQRALNESAERSPEAYRAAAHEVERLEGKLRELQAAESKAAAENRDAQNAVAYRNALNDVAVLETEHKRLARTMTDGSARMAEMGKRVRTLGYGFYSTLTPAIIGAGYYTVTAADQMDSAYRDMRKTVDGTEEQFEALRQMAMDFSRTHVTSADQMLEIQAMGGQLGIGVEKLGDFSEAISNITVATTIQDANLAAEQLGQMSNVMSDMRESIASGDNTYERFADTLVRLGNNSATTEDKIMNIAQRVGGVASMFGMSTPDVLAWATAISSTGQKSESAATAFTRTMSGIEGAVAKGGEKLDAYAEIAGTSARKFAATWNSNPTAALKMFVEGLARVDKSGGSVDQTLQGIGITGVRQKQLLNGLTKTVGDLSKKADGSAGYLQMAAEAWDHGGDAAAEADKKAQGFSGQLAILKNNLQVLATEAADGFAPILSGVNDLVQGATKVLKALPPEAKTAITGVAAALALVGPGSIAIGTTLDGIGQISQALGRFPDAFSRLRKGAALASTSVATGAEVARSAFLRQNGAITAAEKAMARAESAAGGASASLSSVAGPLAVLATLFGVTLFEAVKPTVEHMLDVRDATGSFADMQRKASAALHATSGEFGTADAAMRTYAEGAQASYEAIREAADSARRAQDKLDEAYSDVGEIRAYAEDIERLMGKGRLGESEQAQLAEDVKAFNKVTGSSIEVTDAVRGKLKDLDSQTDLTADGFRKLAEAEENEALKSAVAEARAESLKQQVKNKEALVQAGRDLADAERALNESENDSEIPGLTEKVKNAKERYDELAKSVSTTASNINQETEMMNLLDMASKKGADSIAGFVNSNDAVQGTIWGNYQSVTGFVEALEKMGVTQGQLSQMAPEQLSQLASAYDGTAESVKKSLEGMGVQAKTSSEEVAESARRVADETKKASGTKEVEFRVSGDKETQKKSKKTARETRKASGTKKTKFVASGEKTVAGKAGKASRAANKVRGTRIAKFVTEGTASVISSAKRAAKSYKEVPEKKPVKFTESGAVAAAKSAMNVTSKVKAVPTKWKSKIKVKADTSGARKAKKAISSVRGKTVYITVKRKGSASANSEHAAGGLIGTHGATLAYHASGYIANRAMSVGYTGSVEHIAGEAGAEAVIPLTNRRYVRPFARAVAAEIPQRSAGATQVINISLNYQAGDDANKMVRDIRRAIQVRGRL